MNIEPRPPVSWMRRVWPATGTLPAYPYDRTTIAHHEAAHAVLFTLAGRRIGQAQIAADDDPSVNGRVTFADFPSRRSDCENGVPISVTPIWHEPFQPIAVSYAVAYEGGTLSEMLLHGVDVEDGHYLLMDSVDSRAARRMLWVSFASFTPMFYCQRLARALLTENWAWVQAVAYELERHGAADADTVDRLGRAVGAPLPVDSALVAGPPGRAG